MTVSIVYTQSQYKVWIRFGEILELGERGGNRDLTYGVNIIILHILTEQHGQVYGGSALRILSYPKSTPPGTGQAASQTLQLLHRLAYWRGEHSCRTSKTWNLRE